MCGIVGYTGRANAAPILLDGLKKLEYRGYDSAGVAVINDKKLFVSKTAGRISALCEKTDNGENLPGFTGIGHTRWATHGAPTDINAHPHTSNDGKFAVVHNGIIENYMSLKEELVKKGYEFESQTDTEVIVHLLEMYYTGDVKIALLKTAARLSGSYALGVICSDYPEKVFAVREASPLIIGLGVGENYFASDVTALVQHTKNIIYMDDGDFAEITPDEVKIFDFAGKPKNKPVNRIEWDIRAAEKDGYDHFMLKEIMEQPRAVRDTLSPRIKDDRVCFDEINLTDEDINKINRIVITACGSAYYAGCAGKYTLEKLTGIPVSTELASELRYSQPLIDDRTLVIVLSQSGETADTIAAMKECKKRGAKVLSVVNVVGSTVAKLADYVIYTWAGPEIAVATTKGYTTQVTVLYLLALYIADRSGRITPSDYAKTLASIQKIPQLIRQALSMNSAIPTLAKKYHIHNSMFFIGRNTDYAVALEGALKMKEISYIHAEAYAAGELKHGTIALIDDYQPVVALCCNKAIMEKTISNIIEVKARGAQVLALAEKDNSKIVTIADDIIFMPEMDDYLAAPVEIVPLQLLAYYMAKENGCDIDKPKNLAKSVTVE